MKFFLFAIFFLFAGWISKASWGADRPVLPKITSPVYDETNLITEEQKIALNDRLWGWSSGKIVQIQIVILNNLQDVSIEEFAIKLASEYQWGEKGKDNGILFLMSLSERKMRIEVGKGLEGAIPDIYTARIIRDIKSYFQEKKFFEGLVFLTNSLYALVLKEFPQDEMGKQQTAPSHQSKSPNGLKKIGLYIFFFIFLIVSLIQRFFSPSTPYVRRSSGWYGGSGGGGWGSGGGGSSGGGWGGGGGGFSGGGSSGDW
ncbi:MAG: TPM domain-containing protein [Bacteriovoracaceae bacterium]|nr:TPM domain-containing protein [Bacteriovoracaceae bacterium]